MARSDFSAKLAQALLETFAGRLAAMTQEERRNLVDSARRETRWPSRAWLEQHARTHGLGRTPEQYAAWAQTVKVRLTSRVYAMIHVVHGTEALAFIDPVRRELVWFGLEDQVNLSCFALEVTADAFVARTHGLYLRLMDTELM